MIRETGECKVELRKEMRGGPGTVQIVNFADKNELLNKARLFCRIVLDPGCGIGAHEHTNESEIFFIEEGEADYNDNGVMKHVKAGDVTICSSGETHSITNNYNEVCKLVALIVLN